MSDNLEQQNDGGGETILCPVCGVENPANAEVCIDCSFTFGEDMEVPGNEETQEPTKSNSSEVDENGDGIICGGCGAELPIDTTSCFICGEDVNALEEETSAELDAVVSTEPDAEASAEPVSEAEDQSTDSEEPGEDWDLGVIGGDDVPDESGDIDDLDLDDELSEEPEDTDAPDEEPQDALPELGPNEFHCPSCSKAIPMGTSKCSNCWADIPDMIRCPQCEITIPMVSDACPECFAKLKNGVLIDVPEEELVEAFAEVDEFDEVDEDLMPQEEETEEFFEEVTEVYGVECPFCKAIANVSDDICPECGMPLIEDEEQPKLKSGGLKQQIPERDWYRIIAFSLVLVLLGSAIIPFVIPLPHVDRLQIRIDGSFDDWEPITSHADSSEFIAEFNNIDIIDYKMTSDAFNVYFYIQVAGRAFGDADGDTSRIFIDLDQDSSTGYSIMGIGADYQIRVFGHGGDVESSSCLQFDQTKNQTDFNGFESFCPSVPHTAIEEFDKFEVRVALEDLGLDTTDSVTAVYYMGDTLGNRDYSDTPLCNIGSLLFVEQESIVDASGIISGPSADVLALTMTAIGEPFDIAGISIDNSTGTYPTSMEGEEVLIVNLTIDATGRPSGSLVHEKASSEDFNVPDAHVVVIGQGAFAYANSAPALIEIDGAFADWAGKGMTFDDLDGPTMKNGIDENNDAGLDMLDQTTVVENNILNILVNSGGDMLAGMWVPEIEETYVDTMPDTRAGETNQPDYTYSEPQVDRTRAPDLQRPIAKPEKTGEGAVKVFIDMDNDPATGYIIEDIGADYLVEALGQDGLVTSTRFSSFSGSDQNLQEWTIESVSTDAATSGSSVEISVSMEDLDDLTDVTANATAVIQLVDWNLNGDISDLTAWDIFETGARRGTRNFDPDGGGLKGMVTIDGVTPVGNATVIARNGFNQLTAYVSFESLPGWNNYFITLSEANYNQPIDIYGIKDGKFNYRKVTYPSDNKVPNAVDTDFPLSEDIPSVSPQNVQLTNLGTIEKAIQLNWDHGSDPTSYKIFTTNLTGNYISYENRGRYYHFQKATLAGTSTSYIHTDPVYNQTNYYIIQAVNGTDYNYSQEIGMVADYWAPEISHTLTTAQANSAYVNISANITDGFGVSSATVFYRKGSTGPWAELTMSNYLGTPQNGSWRAWIPIDYAGESTAYYQYYITANDGTQNSAMGGSGVPAPMDFTSSSPGEDPYPIYGYVKWGDGTLVGPGVDVYIEWVNTTGPWASSVIHDSSISPGDPNAFPEITNAQSQYSIDMMQYDHFSTIWGNATINGIWGYNITFPNEPSPGEFDGGKLFNITLEAPALNITKTAPEFANAGENIIYTIVVNNTGNTTAYNVNITDTLSPDVTFVSAVPPETDNIGNVYYWDSTTEPALAALAPGEYFWINVTVQINFGVLIGTIVTNNANASWSNSTLVPWWGEVSDTADTLIGAADMNITKWATPIANPGELITYWINYTNEGNQWATNVSITETYPAGVTFVSSIPAPTAGNNYWDYTTVFTLAALAPGASNSIQIFVTVDADANGTLTNMANITAPGLLVVWDFANTTIRNANMTVTKEGPAFANTGEIITYWINYTNNGDDIAYNVVITENYPAGVTFVDAYPMPFPVPGTWDIGNLAIGESGSIMVNVSINAGVAGNITNWVYLNYENGVGSMPEESDSAITWIGDPLLYIEKFAPPTANTGETIVYSIYYENTGNATAYNVVITETYPVGVTYVGAIPAPTVPFDNIWDSTAIPALAALAPGAFGWIDVTLTVDLDANGTLTNWVSAVYEDNNGQVIGPVMDSADTLIIDPIITVTKEGPAAANTGENIIYWINYSNTGTDWAYNINITEDYPPDVTFISSTPAPTFSNNVWIIAALADGDWGSIEITVQINAGAIIDQINNVFLNYTDNAGEDQPIETDNVTTAIDDPLMIIQKDGPLTANPGEIIQYNITYQNIGSDTAYDVVITEFYPPEVTFISAIPAPDVPTDNVWSLGNILPGAFDIILITVQIDSDAVGTITNWASLDYNDNTGQAQPTEWDDHETIITGPNMEIWKTGPANASAGETIMYQIDYFNSGSDTAQDVTIIETYPADITFVNANPAPTSGNNIWYIGDVPSMTGGTIFINVTIDASATGILVNNVTVEYNNTSNQTMDPKWSEWSIFLDGPWMNITKTGPFVANTGENITYTIQFTNNGTDTAYNVTVTENYPADVTFVSAIPTPDVPTNNVWTIASVAPNETVWINVTVHVEDSAPWIITNWVFLNYTNDADLDLPTESDWWDTFIEDPLVTIDKTGPVEANPGQTVTYIITYTNNGPGFAYNLNITEFYPVGVTFVDAFPMPTFGNDVWIIPILAPWSSGTILVNVTITATNGTLTNYVTLDYEDNAGENQTSDSDDHTIEIINPYIQITKQAPAFAAPGEQFTYWINVTNLGTDWAYNVTVTDYLPAGVIFISSIPLPTVPNYIWVLGDIAPNGGSASIEIVVMVTASAPSTEINWANVTYNNTADVEYYGNVSATTNIIDCLVTVTKIAPAQANTGEPITYSLYYENTGLDWAYNVEITETYPANVAFVSAIPAPDIPTNNYWSIGALAPGTGGYINITVTVDTGLAIDFALVNNVIVDFENAGGIANQNPGQNITLIEDPLMLINKTGPATATPGETISYQIDYWNAGNDTAYNVNITEFYPPEVSFVSAFPTPDIWDNIWYIGNVAPGTGGTIIINVTISISASGNITNLAELTYNNGFVDMDPVTAINITNVDAAYVQIIKSAPNNAAEGESFSYTIFYINIGNDTAYNLWINDTLPAILLLPDSVYPSEDLIVGGQTYCWNIGNLAPGAFGTIYINVTVPIGALILYNFVWANYTTDPTGNNQINHTDFKITVIDGPLLNITKSAPAFANSGSTISYWINVTNVGNNVSYNTWFNETYPVGVTLNPATVPPPVIPTDNMWYLGDIPAGATVTLQIIVDIADTATGILTNIVSVDYDDQNGAAQVTEWAFADTLIIDPLLTVSKEAPQYANTGEDIIYWINVTNIGSDTAFNINVTENYPAGISFVSSAPVPDFSDNVWIIPSLAPFATRTIMITVHVDASSGILTNTVFVNYTNGAGRQMPIISATADTEIINPSMEVAKWAPAFANPGESISYWIYYWNNGTDWAYNVVITETYPAGVTFTGAIPAPDFPTNNEWTFTIAPDGNGSIQIFVTLGAGLLPGTILNNTVTLDYDNNAGIAQTQEDDYALTEIIQPEVTITKTGPVEATQGETIMYWITYENTGSDIAYNVTINEVYPPGVTFQDSNPWPTVPNTVWIIPILLPGQADDIYINVTIDNTTTGVLTNWVYLDYDNAIGDSLPQKSNFTVTTIIYPTLEITKTASAFDVNTGEQVTYTIVVENIGDDTAYNIVVTEDYPAGIIFVSAAPIPGPGPWTIPIPLAPGEMFWINVTVNVTGTTGLIINTAIVVYENSQGVISLPESDTAQINIINPDMEITKWAPPSANTLQTITYYVNYTNNGDDWAFNVIITETYPADVSFVSSFPLAPVVPTDNVWNIGNLAPGDSGTLWITVQIGVNASGLLTNFVELAYNNSVPIEQTPVNATAGTLIGDPMMEIIKTAPINANVNETIMYTIYYWNNGTVDAYNVTITETYPAGVAFVDANPAPTTPDNIWLIGTVPAGGSGVIFINVTVDANATGVLTNTVDLEYEDEAGLVRPIESDFAITIITGPFMTVDKTAPEYANPGETIMYTISYSNIGTDTAYNVWINETFPAGVTFLDASPSNETTGPYWLIGDLLPGESGIIFINVTIDSDATGTLINTATAEYHDDVGGMYQVIAIDDTIIREPIIEIEKDGQSTANPGGTITYWINYTNVGSDWAHNVTITDTYPAGVTFVSSLPVNMSGIDNMWYIGSVAPNGTSSIMVIVAIDINAIGVLTNYVEATYNNSAGQEMNPVNDTFDTTIVNPLVEIAKGASTFWPTNVLPGEVFTYTINYWNNGTDWACNVWITENYPAEITWIGAMPNTTFGNNMWFIGTLAPDDSGSIDITVQVNANATGSFTNYVMANYENSVGTSMEPANAELTLTVIAPNIEVEKSAPAFANTGETIYYTIYVNNTGNAPAVNVELTEFYPAGVTFVNAIPFPDVDNNFWILDTIWPGMFEIIQIELTVDLTAFGTLINNVLVNYTDSVGLEYPSEPAQNSTEIIDPAMSIIKDGPAFANPGETITYWINYTNYGSDYAFVNITENYPAGVTFQYAIPAPTTSNNIWNLGMIPAGASGSIMINVTIDISASGTLTNWAYLDYESEVRPFPQEDAWFNTTIIEPDMEITKDAPGTANTGQIITYWINYSNAGDDWAYDVYVTENYPAEVTYIGASPVPTSGNNIWYLGDLAPGASGSIQITVRVNYDAIGPLTNWANMNYSSSAMMFWENVSAVTGVIDPALTISKTAPNFANQGETIYYEILVENIGSDYAYDVYVTEMFPPGVNVISSVPAPFLGNNLWYFASIAPGNSVLINVTLEVSMNTLGFLTNWVYVDYEDSANEPQEREWASASTMVSGPQMQISKWATPSANATDFITYYINYTNVGNGWAYNVIITETYPVDVTFFSAVPNATFGNNVWVIGTVAPGASGSIMIVVQVNPFTVGILENLVTLTYENAIGIPYRPVWDVAYTVLEDIPYVDIQKSAPASANSGEIIMYIITYQNLGLVPAYDVWINETYPFGVTFLNSNPVADNPGAGDNIWSSASIPILAVLPPGAIGYIFINVTVTGQQYGILTNVVTIDYSNAINANFTGFATAPTLIVDALMDVSKTGPPVAAQFSTVMYTIIYENVGNDTAYNVVIMDTYPAGAVFAGANPAPSIGNNGWDSAAIPALAALAPGAGGVIYVNLTLNQAGIVYNNVSLDWENRSAYAKGPVAASVPTFVIGGTTPYVVIEKWAPAEAVPGETITYLLNYSNIGDGVANNVVITDTYPLPDVAYVSAFPAPSIGNNGWDNLAIPALAALNPGDSGTIMVNVTIALTATGTLMNQVDVIWTGGDNVDWANTTIVNPDMYIEKTAPAQALWNDVITYTLTYYNIGTAPAYNVNITENYDAGVVFGSATPPPDFGNNIWVIPVILPGTSDSITIDVTVTAASGTIVINNVSMDYNNTASIVQPTEYAEAQTDITNVELVLTKTAPAVADPGTNMFYFINIYNRGPNAAPEVTLTDVYPSGVTFVNSWLTVNLLPEVVRLPDEPTNDIWYLGAMPVFDSWTLRVEVYIDPMAPDILLNTAQVNYTDSLLNWHWVNDTATTATSGPLMELTKTANLDYVSPGEFITYTIYYENIGPGPALNVTITEYYPAGVTFVSATPSPDQGNNVWHIGVVNGTTSPPTSGQIVITVFVTPAAAGTLTNWVTLNYTNITGGWLPELVDSAQTTVLGGLTLMDVTKSGPAAATNGEVVTYTITYRNIGTAMVYNAYIDDYFLTTELAYAYATPPPTFTLGETRRWWIGTLAPGEGGTIDVTFTITAAGGTSAHNNVYLNYTDILWVPQTPVQDIATTIISNPLMNITKEGPAVANSGQQITYWINYTNTGAIAINATITEIFSPNVVFVSSIPVPSFGSTWLLPDLSAGASGSIEITVDILPGLLNGTWIDNTVNLSYENDAYVPQTNESATVSTQILDPSLIVVKSVPATANSGQTITYTIDITNDGGALADNIVVTETYPPGIIFNNAVPMPDFGDNVWYVPALDFDETYQIVITVRVDPNVASGTWLNNIVDVDYEGESGVPQLSAQGTADTQVLDPLLIVTKIGPAVANTNETITYNITIQNIGDAPAYDVNITELYSAWVVFASSDPMPDYGNNIWNISVINVGQTFYLLVNVTIIDQYDVTNWVFVDYDDFAGEAQPQISDAAITNVLNPHVTIQKTANATVVPGGYILYNITYENIGTGNATNVTITDLYPADVTYLWASPLPTIGTDTWVIADIPANTTGWILILVQVDVNTTLGTILTNEATLTCQNQANLSMEGMMASAITRVIGPIMTIQKYGPVNVSAGEMFNYTIVYTNTGTDWAYNVTISDIIPQGITVLNVIPGPTSTLLGNYVWNIGTVAPGASATIQLTVMGTVAGTRINTAILNYENAAGISLPEINSSVSTDILGIVAEGPPEVTSTPPDFIFAGQNFTLYASALDNLASDGVLPGIDTVILYWVDIYGVQYTEVMVPLLIGANGNGVYQLQLPPQPYKGMISYFVWVNDTDGNSNRTGIYDVPVRLPPYFVWGYIYSANGDTVDNGIVQITDMETNETVMAMTDVTGYYQVDLATLYSGYLNDEEILIYATDGLYYGSNASYIDLDFFSDMDEGLDEVYDGWPNRHVDVVLSEIPEFTMVLTPIIGIMILVLFLRRNRRREEDEYEN